MLEKILLKNNVGFIRAEIKDMHDEWELIRDCLIGETAVKLKTTKYLPYPSSVKCDDGTVDNDLYEQYITRANFLNTTRRTIYHLLGEVFIKPPVVEVEDNELIKKLLENATGNGVSLEQCAKNSLKHNIAYAYGCVILLIDEVAPNLTKAQFNAGAWRPRVKNFSPFQIRNFRIENVNGEEKLTLVVLGDETYIYDNDGFETEHVEMLHVMQLIDGKYRYREYRSKNIAGTTISVGNYELYREYYPTDAHGQHLNAIPCFFFGMENNNPYPDVPIMYDLASLNIAHYRNSADYEQTMFIAGQATLVLTGSNSETTYSTDDAKEPTIKMGVNRAILLKNGGTAALLQAKSDTGLFEAMDTKEKQMAALGARFLKTSDVVKTAYQVKVENPAQSTILGNCAANVANAYTDLLKFAHVICGLDPNNVRFELNTDFEYNRVGSEEITTATNCYITGGISFKEWRDVLRRARLASEDDEVVLKEVEKRKAEEAQKAQQQSTGENAGTGNNETIE